MYNVPVFDIGEYSYLRSRMFAIMHLFVTFTSFGSPVVPDVDIT